MRITISAILSFVLFSAVSAAAATLDLDKAMAEYQQAKPCCATFSDLRVENFDWNDSPDISIGPESGIFKFASGNSYYRAFTLPTIATDYSVTIESELMGNAVVIVTSQSCFYPIATLLDENRKVVAETADADIRYHEGSLGPGWVSLTVPVLAAMHARYIVIHTAEAALGADTAMSFPVKRPSPAGPLGGLLFNIPGRTDWVSFPGAPAANGSISMKVKEAL